MPETTIIWIINGLTAVASALVGWFAKVLWNAVQELKQDLAALRVEIAKDYIPYNRLKDAMEPIMDALSEIKETLKTKADK